MLYEPSLTAYLEELLRLPRLSLQEERDLVAHLTSAFPLAQQEAARMQLFQASLPWVARLARSFSSSGLPLSELIGEGNLALLVLLRRYKPKKKDGLFRTYALWYVSRTLLVLTRRFYKKAVMASADPFSPLSAQTRKAITRGELDEFDDTPPLRCLSLEMLLEEQEAAVQASEEEESFSTTSTLLLPCVPFDRRMKQCEALERALSDLPLRQRTVLSLRFFEDETLETIGKRLHVTRERIRQIEAKALRTLRRSKHLKEMHT